MNNLIYLSLYTKNNDMFWFKLKITIYIMMEGSQEAYSLRF